LSTPAHVQQVRLRGGTRALSPGSRRRRPAARLAWSSGPREIRADLHREGPRAAPPAELL